MDTHTVYDIRRTTRLASEFSDASPTPRDRIRAALALRGETLRAWALRWAARTGRDPEAAYSTVRMSVQRWAHRREEPRGAVAREVLEALRADLGPAVVPVQTPRTRPDSPAPTAAHAAPAGGRPASTRRTRP